MDNKQQRNLYMIVFIYLVGARLFITHFFMEIYYLSS